jgi:hypothetical protein
MEREREALRVRIQELMSAGDLAVVSRLMWKSWGRAFRCAGDVAA